MLLSVVQPEFFEKHGQFPVPIHGKVFLFEDGATVDCGGYQASLFDPPENLAVRLKACKDYQTARLKLVSEAFTKLKAALLGTGPQYYWDTQQFGPQPEVADHFADPEGGQAALRRLKILHDGHKVELAEIEKELAALPEVRRQREKEEAFAKARADQQAREQARRAVLESIEL